MNFSASRLNMRLDSLVGYMSAVRNGRSSTPSGGLDLCDERGIWGQAVMDIWGQAVISD